MYCNGPSFNASVGERVRFYVMTLGTEADLHTPNVLTSQWMQQVQPCSLRVSISLCGRTAVVCTFIVTGNCEMLVREV